MRKPFRLIICLMLGMLLAACSSNKLSDEDVYVVKRGDTLSRISRLTGTSVRDLARLNGISPPYTIEIGQRLRTNGSGKKASGKSSGGSSSRGTVVLPYSSADGGNKGIDIAGSRGQAIYAAGSGKVVYVGNQLRGYGNLIMIKHSEDYITAYAHNDTLLVNNGQSVKIGQKIATMGSSDTDSVKLHFQLRYRATAIDPIRYLPPQGTPPKC